METMKLEAFLVRIDINNKLLKDEGNIKNLF